MNWRIRTAIIRTGSSAGRPLSAQYIFASSGRRLISSGRMRSAKKWKRSAPAALLRRGNIISVSKNVRCGSNRGRLMGWSPLGNGYLYQSLPLSKSTAQVKKFGADQGVFQRNQTEKQFGCGGSRSVGRHWV